MSDRKPFEPLGTQARWRTVYEILKLTPTGNIITYEKLAEALGLDPEDDRPKIVQAVRRAAKEHEEHDKRAVDSVHGKGYRPVDPRGSLALAQRQQRKSGRALARGQSKAVNVDLNGVDPEVRKALELVGSAISAQLDFNRRLMGNQVRLEQDLRAIRESQQGDRERNDSELAELKARLARLEGTDGTP